MKENYKHMAGKIVNPIIYFSENMMLLVIFFEEFLKQQAFPFKNLK